MNSLIYHKVRSGCCRSQIRVCTRGAALVLVSAFVSWVLLGGGILLSSAAAQVYNCGGKWTNKPCDGDVSKTLKADPRIEKLKAQRAKAVTSREESAESAAEGTDGAAVEIEAEAEAEAATEAPDPAVQRAAAQKRQAAQAKRQVVSSLKSLNRACGNFYSPTDVKAVARSCSSDKTSLDECRRLWDDKIAGILAQSKDEDCRKSVFAADNRLKRN